MLRGFPAIALPHPKYFLELDFTPGKILEVQNDNQFVVRKLIKKLNKNYGESPRGVLKIENQIPSRAGLGSSAALCVALTRWHFGEPDQELLIQVATELEHDFHGESSGLDIAVVAMNTPLRFIRGQDPAPIKVLEMPQFNFVDTRIRSNTRDCVAAVVARLAADPALEKWDQLMGSATERAIHGLEEGDQREVVRAMNQAQECFQAWGLSSQAIQARIAELKANGMDAVKLTGAGRGGFLVSL